MLENPSLSVAGASTDVSRSPPFSLCKMLAAWCVVVACVGTALAAPSGVSVQVGAGGVGVDVGTPHTRRTFGKTVDVNVDAGGVGVDVAAPHNTRSFGKPVEVDVGAGGVNVDVGKPHDTQRTSYSKVVDVNVGGGHPHTHSHHVFKTHTVDPNFRNTQTYAALDNAGSDLFQGLGNAATALGDFLSRILGGGRH